MDQIMPLPLFALETETIVTLVGLVMGSIVTGASATYIAIKGFNKEQLRKDKEETRKDAEQEEKTLLIVVNQQNVIIAELRGELVQVNKRLDSRDRELMECHKERSMDRERIARLEERAGIPPNASLSSIHLPLTETQRGNPGETHDGDDGVA